MDTISSKRLSQVTCFGGVVEKSVSQDVLLFGNPCSPKMLDYGSVGIRGQMSSSMTLLHFTLLLSSALKITFVQFWESI